MANSELQTEQLLAEIRQSNHLTEKTDTHADESVAAFQAPQVGMDWRIALGAAITFLWIALGIVYLFGKVGWISFINLPTGDIGSFLEGAFAPLAFLWLVIGHFMQQKEITANTDAIRQQQEITARQELHAQRDSYFKLSNLVHEQLGSISALHYISVVGSTGTAEVTLDEYLKMRADAVSDTSFFIRKMIELTLRYRDEPNGLNELYLGTEIRQRHARNFLTIFEKLLKLAEGVDQDGLIKESLLYGSPAGTIYRILRVVNGEDSVDPFLSGSPAKSNNP